MTLFEFECPRCLLVLERFVRPDDRPHLCPRCYDANQATVLRRRITAPAIRGATVSRP